MKKINNKFLCSILALSFAFTCVSCEDKNSEESSSAEEVVDSSDYFGRHQQVEKSDKYLVSNKKSDYKILLPENSNSSEQYAADEFNVLLNEASNTKLEIVDDSQYNANDKYISLGKTKLLTEAGSDYSYTNKTRNSFAIKSYNDNLLFSSVDNAGLLYSVYRFFELNCNYMFYTTDEIRIEKSESIALFNYNYEDWPDFPERDVYNKTTHNDPATTSKYYLTPSIYSSWNEKYGEGTWWSSLNDQSMVLQIVPYSTYRANNPSWYYGKGGGTNATNPQLCFSKALDDMAAFEKGEWFDENGSWKEGYNDGSHGLFWTFCYNLIKNYISVETDKTLFQIGMSDNEDFCNCDRCKEEIAKYTRTGIVIRFVNQVADVVKAWQEVNCPERTIYLTMFAYLTVVQPPVEKVNGEFVPIDESVVLRDNIVLRYAPIGEYYLFPLLDEDNNANANFQMNGWKALATHFAVWDYIINFGELLDPFPSWMTMYSNLKAYYDYGYIDIYNQGNSFIYDCAFYYFDMWMRSRLLWDIHSDYDTLKDEFLEAYYGPASSIIDSYMSQLAYHYLGVMNDNGYKASAHTVTGTMKNYSLGFIESLKTLLEEGKLRIEEDNTLSVEEKAKFQDRIVIETMFYRYLEIHLYSSMFSSEQLETMIDSFEEDCKKYSLNNYNNWQSIYTIIASWREKL